MGYNEGVAPGFSVPAFQAENANISATRNIKKRKRGADPPGIPRLRFGLVWAGSVAVCNPFVKRSINIFTDGLTIGLKFHGVGGCGSEIRFSSRTR